MPSGYANGKKDVAFVSGISEGTIKSTYQDLLEYKTKLVPKELHSALALL
jgi:transcription initiation factor TFIIIB Brf1 subunit/transcription initiation factor TFIIB